MVHTMEAIIIIGVETIITTTITTAEEEAHLTVIQVETDMQEVQATMV